jgi:transketolase
MTKYKYLQDKALKLRQDTYNAFIDTGEAHVGGSFSMIETFLALHEEIITKYDKFILSKAHASYPYQIYLRGHGFNPKITTHLELDRKNSIHCTTGSLGHGFPMAVGMALSRKKTNKPGKIYVMVGDGECQEGTTWESLLIAARFKLDNLVLLIDYNKIQALDSVQNILPLDNLPAKFKAFNWNVREVLNGHNFEQIIPSLKNANAEQKPLAIIFHTVKGKGIKAFENSADWHARKVKGDDIDIGKRALGLI